MSLEPHALTTRVVIVRTKISKIAWSSHVEIADKSTNHGHFLMQTVARRLQSLSHSTRAQALVLEDLTLIEKCMMLALARKSWM